MMLDQRKLPLEVVHIPCRTYRDVAEGIRNLSIRGAPAIGIAAAMGLVQGVRESGATDGGELIEKLKPVYEYLLATRPTAVNLKWALDRMVRVVEENCQKPVDEIQSALRMESERILEEDAQVNRRIGEAGAFFVRDGNTVLTHCNAGALATGGWGTATAVIRVAAEQGKRIRVLADETRPVLQGARLTTWELMQDGIDVTLIPDSAAGSLMRSGGVDMVVVGTDRTTRNGDVANKIGTYPLAVLAKENGIPFYVAAPLSSIDFSMESGDSIPIEERAPEEVTRVGDCRIAPEGVKVRNPAFDVTPARYVSAFFTELGAYLPADLGRLANPDEDLERLRIDSEAAKRPV